jgi:hypothetical protein
MAAQGFRVWVGGLPRTGIPVRRAASAPPPRPGAGARAPRGIIRLTFPPRDSPSSALPSTQEREVTDAFSRFGRVVDIFVARNPGGFAFVVS